MGASLLIFKNKNDVPDCMAEEEICKVRLRLLDEACLVSSLPATSKVGR